MKQIAGWNTLQQAVWWLTQFTTHRRIELQLTAYRLIDLQVTNHILFDCNSQICNSQTRSFQTWLAESHYFPIGFFLAFTLCKLKWNKGNQIFWNNVFYDKKEPLFMLWFLLFFSLQLFSILIVWYVILFGTYKMQGMCNTSFVLTRRTHMLHSFVCYMW